MIDAAALTAALKRLVLVVEDDLRARVDGRDTDARQAGVCERWREEYDAAFEARRTGRTWTEWRDDRVTQAAVAWVLISVFVRFCEDNGLLRDVWIEGPPIRRQEAQDARADFFRRHPEWTDREWLTQPIEHFRSLPATRDLVEPHSPLWLVAPSGAAAERILAFWHERDGAGGLRWDFTDPELSTRFLGDLYQDLSEYAKATYALLQTPEFVEEFILDRTLEPALAERPLEGFRLIDPTCGSGHFLLGAFRRLFGRWQAAEPGTNAGELARRALDSVVGVDLNPFAVAVARFRLLIAVLQVTGERDLANARDVPLHLAVGDSLLDWANFLPGKDMAFAYATEDAEALAGMLVPGSYDVVVGNPPYITVKDKTLNQRYRELYDSCKGTYALTVPFMERFFGLAKTPAADRPAGWVGQITSNSFMKREFGSKLIEQFLPRQDLRLVVDTSGAYIPYHGTPTVIVVGRPGRPVGDTVRAVLGIRGEPGRPADAAQGLVWRSIVDHVDEAGHEDGYTSTTDLPRPALASHPWSLTGGEASALVVLLASRSQGHLAYPGVQIGYTGQTNADDVFLLPLAYVRRLGLDTVREFATGDSLRDWGATCGELALFPYTGAGELTGEPKSGSTLRHLWPYRENLGARATFSGGSYRENGIPWWSWHQVARSRLQGPALSWSVVATHNHFVRFIDVWLHNRHAPVIKLPEGASEDDHLALLGVLNSSTACFWLKQNSHNKGRPGAEQAGADEVWEHRFEFTGTTLQDFPLPSGLPLSRARRLDALASKLSESFNRAFAAESVPTGQAVEQARREYEVLRGHMVAVQEELDWEVYRSYGLVEDDLTLASGQDLPPLAPGERAFAIALARRVAEGAESTSWFTHWNHGHSAVTEIPAHWPAAYRELVQRRLDLIESDRFIGLLERPEYKRRWAIDPWEKRVERAVKTWLLDRLEARELWFDRAARPRPQSVGQLAERLGTDHDLTSVLALWAGKRDIDVAATLERLLADEAVPYLAAHRLKDSGLRKRAEWERTWELQRAEDRGERVGPIPVPPKYTSADFRTQSVWSHRGKLDVPKERFIAYPGGGRPTDPTTLLGWAGWDHAQQSLALATLTAEREADGVAEAALVPLVAGMAELQPWVRQWHDDLGEHGINLADFLQETLSGHMLRLGVTAQDLTDWRPAATTRGRRARKER